MQQANNIVTAVICRPPRTDVKAFSNAMNESLTAITKENKIYYLMGDYTINFLDYGKYGEINGFVNIICAYFFLFHLLTVPHGLSKSQSPKSIIYFPCQHYGLAFTSHSLTDTHTTDDYPIIYIDYAMKESYPDPYFTRTNSSQRSRLQLYNEIAVMYRGQT